MGSLKTCMRQNAGKYLFLLFIYSIIVLFVIRFTDTSTFGSYLVKQQNQESFESTSTTTQIVDIAEPLFDNSDAPNEGERIDAIEKELPSIPYRYWSNPPPKKPLQKSKNCAKFPSVLQLNYHNKYWQTYEYQNTTIQLYNAYYDKRAALPAGPVVRLLAMINNIPFSPGNQNIHCQLWYDDSAQPSFTIATEFRSIWNAFWGKPRYHFYPHLISCPLPKTKVGSQIPKVVSLVTKECDTATNSLRVHYEVPIDGKQKFAVCVKGMDYPYIDISARLVEWIELQLILGASKIYFYNLEIHPNVAKVLAHYAQRGLVDVRDITLAGGEPSLSNLQHFLLEKQRMKKRLNELIPYNDCFYRNLYRYDYIAVQDIDEVIMPLGNRTQWTELMTLGMEQHPKRCPNGYASYCFRNIYFTNKRNSTTYSADVPSFMHMIQNVQRSEHHLAAGKATKCFHRTDQVLTLHNHFSRAWLQVCGAHTFKADIAQMHHYRDRPVITKTVIDLSVWRFKDKLLQRSLDALTEMGFLRMRIRNDSS